MTIQERFGIGLYLSSSSFWMLWLHKKLLIYLSSVLFLFYFVPLFFKNAQLFGLARGEILSYSIAFDLGFFIYVYLLTFLLIALIQHALAIIHGNVTISVRTIIGNTLELWTKILAWSLVLIGVIFVFRKFTAVATYLPSIFSLLLIAVAVVLSIGFLLAAFLILPVIAVERCGVWFAMRRSIRLVSTVFVEVIAALCWLGIMICLGAMIFLMLTNYCGGDLCHFFITWAALLGIYVIYSALAVTQALLYQRSVQLMR